jgi:hypothetical protein
MQDIDPAAAAALREFAAQILNDRRNAQNEWTDFPTAGSA